MYCLCGKGITWVIFCLTAEVDLWWPLRPELCPQHSHTAVQAIRGQACEDSTSSGQYHYCGTQMVTADFVQFISLCCVLNILQLLTPRVASFYLYSWMLNGKWLGPLNWVLSVIALCEHSFVHTVMLLVDQVWVNTSVMHVVHLAFHITRKVQTPSWLHAMTWVSACCQPHDVHEPQLNYCLYIFRKKCLKTLLHLIMINSVCQNSYRLEGKSACIPTQHSGITYISRWDMGYTIYSYTECDFHEALTWRNNKEMIWPVHIYSETAESELSCLSWGSALFYRLMTGPSSECVVYLWTSLKAGCLIWWGSRWQSLTLQEKLWLNIDFSGLLQGQKFKLVDAFAECVIFLSKKRPHQINIINI